MGCSAACKMPDEGRQMESCKEVGRRIGELAALPVAGLPAGARDHLAGCPRCAGALAAVRLRRGLLAAAADPPEPPAKFADQIVAALPASRAGRADEDLWRLGWRLVPAFATTVVLLLVLYQASPVSGPTGLVEAEALSAGERLVLEGSPPEPDAILAAVMEGGGA